MIQEKFKIEPKQLYDRLTGEPAELITEVIIRILQWSIYDPTIGAYIEYFDDKGNSIPTRNKYIPVPEDWGTDNMVVVRAFADFIKVKLIEDDDSNVNIV